MNEKEKSKLAHKLGLASVKSMESVRLDENEYYVFKDTGKLVHRWKASKKYGLKYEDLNGKVVHHIDGDKTNNSYSNLILLQNQKDHELLHNFQKENLLVDKNIMSKRYWLAKLIYYLTTAFLVVTVCLSIFGFLSEQLLNILFLICVGFYIIGYCFDGCPGAKNKLKEFKIIINKLLKKD